MKARILVVGGGIAGTTIALRAAARLDPLREPVVLVERSELGAGSSGRSGAILRQNYAEVPLAAMARDSLRSYAGFDSRTGRSIGFRRTGVLSLAGADQPEWRERLARNAEGMQSIGIEARIVGDDEIRRLVPGIEVRPGTLGVWEPEGGVVDSRRTLEETAALARTYGAVTRLGVEVLSLGVEDGRVTRVETSEGTYEVRQLVVCAGPWSARLLADAGVHLPLRCLRPETAFLRLPGSYLDEDVADTAVRRRVDLEDPIERITEELSGASATEARKEHPVLLDFEHGFYARCESREGRTRVGRISYERVAVLEDPDALDEDVSEATRSWAREALGTRMPDYLRESDAGGLAGWYALTPDAQPLIGPVPGIEGLFVATGFSGHGFALAPSIGEGVAEMLVGEPVGAFEPAPFDPARFRGDEEWGGAFGL